MIPSPKFSIGYVSLSQAPHTLHFFVWSAWWTGEPSAKPWRTPDASGAVKQAGPGVGEHGIHYNAEAEALTAADDAIRAALGEGSATIQIDDGWARAAERQRDGRLPRYRAPRTEVTFAKRGSGKGRPPTTPAREWCQPKAAWVPSSRAPSAAVAALGLQPGFTEADVQRAYRRIVSSERLHPDHGGDEKRFREVTAARDAALAWVQ